MFRIEHVWVCRCWLLHLFLTVQWDRDRPSVYVDRIINSCVCLAAFWVTLCAVRMCFRRFSLSKAVLESSTYQTGCRPKYVNSSKHTTIQRVYERFFFSSKIPTIYSKYSNCLNCNSASGSKTCMISSILIYPFFSSNLWVFKEFAPFISKWIFAVTQI